MLDTKDVGDNYKMLVTVLVILVININYLFTLVSGTNIQRMAIEIRDYQHLKLINNSFSHQHPLLHVIPSNGGCLHK